MKLNPRFITITSMILLAAGSRLIPHPANFTALSAVALFGAANYNKKILSFLIPITALLISDMCISGFYRGMEWTYGTVLLITFLGFSLRNKVTVPRVAFMSVISSFCIFVFTDIGVWLGSIYPHNWQGLMECYAAALPFLRNGILGDLFYSGLLFGVFYLAQLKFPTLLRQRIK